MNVAHEALSPFLIAVARRSWFVRSVDCARDALWFSSIALLVLSIFHVIGFPVSAQLIILTLAAVALWLLARIAASRVNMATAAALADRTFDGQSLMTTAVECLPNARLAAAKASDVVLSQADANARAWRPHIKERVRVPTRRASTIALIPLFVAIVLFSLRPQNDVTAIDADDTMNASVAAEDVDTLRRALIAEVGAASNRDQSGQDAPPTNLAPATNDITVGAASSRDQSGQDAPPTNLAPPTNDITVGAASSRDAAAAFLPRSGRDPGDLAGTALPGNYELQRRTPVELHTSESIALDRQGEGAATTGRSDSEYRDTTNAPAWYPAQALPAAPPGHTRSRTTLSPAQAAYAARYLAETGDTHEQIDD